MTKGIIKGVLLGVAAMLVAPKGEVFYTVVILNLLNVSLHATDALLDDR